MNNEGMVIRGVVIRNGFLELNSAHNRDVIFVKGSAIVMVQPFPEKGETNQRTIAMFSGRDSCGSRVWLSGGEAFGVLQNPGQVLDAIAESYKQAARR